MDKGLIPLFSPFTKGLAKAIKPKKGKDIMNTYTIEENKVLVRKEGFWGMPKRVSPHGAAPINPDAYELKSDGFSIYNSKTNTYSNYFYGQFLKTREIAEEVLLKLTCSKG